MPPGWAEVTLGEITQPQRIAVDPKTVKDMPFLGLENVESVTTRITGTSSASSVRSTSYLFSEGSTLYARLRPYLNKVCTPTFRGIGSGEFLIFPPTDDLAPGFLKFLLNQPSFVRFTSTLDNGDRPRVNWSGIARFPLALPPRAEQERISAAIDEQFSRIDQGLAALERVRIALKAMKASLLEAAVTGRLAAHDPSPWHKRSLSSLGTLDRGKSRHRPRNDASLYGGRYPFIQTGDVTAADPWISAYTQRYNEAGLAQSRLWPSGTLCITIAANIAKTGLLKFDACFPDSVVGFIATDGPTATRWVELVIRSMQQQLDRLAPATAQKNINLAVLRALQIPYPDLGYQAEVISEYDRQASLVNALDKAVLASINRSDGLRSSILSAAFSGRLVPRDTNGRTAAGFRGSDHRFRGQLKRRSGV